ncbi:MAG: hypothetical protein ACREN8_03110 [Candidatus Dormibacteraceae bacterium]
MSRLASRPFAPILSLLILAPFTVDILFGATQVTTMAGLIPEIITYGCAALLIRGVVRSCGGGWSTILLFGLAFTVISECLIVQTSLAPQIGRLSNYGRAWGVNWLYLTWAMGYVSIWGIVLPIQLTELIYPRLRANLWLRRRGLITVAVVFALGSIGVWCNWTQIVVPKFLHGPSYYPPLFTLAIAIVAAVVLTCAGIWSLRYRASPGPRTDQGTPPPWQVALATVVLGVLWCVLELLPSPVDGWVVRFPPIAPIAVGIALAVGGLCLLRRWSASSTWSDRHRLAAVTGALTASMISGFFVNDLTTPVNLVGKILLNIVALALLAVLAGNSATKTNRSNRVDFNRSGP